MIINVVIIMKGAPNPCADSSVQVCMGLRQFPNHETLNHIFQLGKQSPARLVCQHQKPAFLPTNQ